MRLVDLEHPTLADFTKESIIRSWCGMEGKYVSLKADRGGETNHGITATTAAEYKEGLVSNFGWDGTMAGLTEEMAFWIYDKGWWQKLRCDDLMAIHPFIADRVFDFGINGGRSMGAKTLQRILRVSNRQGADYADIAVDGGIGNGTIEALKAYYAKRGQEGIDNLVFFQLSIQGNHYIELAEKDSTQETFVNGWGSRVSSVNELYQRTLANS